MRVSQATVQPPAALEKLARERNEWKNGQITIVRRGSLYSMYANSQKHFTAQFGGPDNLTIDQGDDEGVLLRTREGAPFPTSPNPMYLLASEGTYWNYVQGETRAEARTGFPAESGGAMNARSLGLSWSASPYSVNGILRLDASAKDIQFSSVDRGDITVVSASLSQETITWELARKQGGLPIRVVREKNGEVVAESRSRLREWNGTWYPELIEFYRKEEHDGQVPYDTIVVSSAVFDAPNLPNRISPATIGIDAGTIVTVRDMKSKSVEGRVWDGAAFITLEEQLKRHERGEWKTGPTHAANFDRAIAEGRVTGMGPRAATTQPRDAKTIESEWEAYTRKFIVLYELDDAQSQRALQVLAKCQEAARKQVAPHNDEYRQIDERLAKLKDLPSDERQKQQAPLIERQKAMLAPLDKIFESQLKPGLEAIPTRAQRQKVTDAKKP
ncbi:MAG: hypothetical protein HZB38_14685 [Planctomycetes bacterium]|nr:hypothetical protein [Planctomycetota bacterium]